MDNYVHSGWCSEIFEQPEFRSVAVESLRKMGVSGADTMDKEQLCVRLGEMTRYVSRGETDQCSATPGIPAERRIALRFGGKLECWDVIELEAKMKDDAKFAASLSEFQQRKVLRSAEAVRTGTVLPCHVLSGNGEACTKQSDRCTYHARTMIGSLFSNATRRYTDNECHMSSEFLTASASTCTKLDIDTLHSLVDDIYYDQLSGQMAVIDPNMSLFERHMFAQDMEFFLKSMKDAARKMSRDELCEVVQDYRNRNAPGEPTWDKVVRVLELVVAKLDLVDRYISVDMLLKVARWIKVTVTDVMMRGLAIMINLLMFIYENAFVSWVAWLLIWPAGRAYILKAFRDPSFAVLFMIGFKFVGLSDPFLPTIEKMSIVVPYAEMFPVLQTVVEQGGKVAVQNGATAVINRENFETVVGTLAEKARTALRAKNVLPERKKVTER